MTDKYLTAEQVADLLQTSTYTVHRLARRREITSTLVGAQRRFKREWVDDYLAPRTTERAS